MIRESNMLNFLKKISVERWVIIVLVFTATYNVFNLQHWKIQDKIIAYDVISYYGYLPATFIYGDVTLQEPNEKYDAYRHTFWYNKTPDGRKVFKTSLGLSVLYSPFFLASHAYVKATGGMDNGFSSPYQFGIAMSSLFYFIIGLLFLRKILLQFYDKKISALVLLLIGLGTNLYHYVVIGPGYAHNYLFCLIAVGIFLLLKWYKNPNYLLSIGLGFIFGLIVLIRPTLILLVLFILLLGVADRKSLQARITFFVSHYQKVLLAMFFAVVVWIPQFLYWKAATGDYMYYSYNEEGFFWSDPKLLEVLFSFRNGWLLYTPIMVFSILGIVWMIRKKHPWGWATLVLIVPYLYVLSCWWNWWFGGSYGYRSMIDLYPILAVALGFFIQQLFAQKKWLRISGVSVLFVLMLFNIFQMRQAHEGLIHHDGMTREAYTKIFLKLKPYITREEMMPYYNTPDYEAALRGERDD